MVRGRASLRTIAAALLALAPAPAFAQISESAIKAAYLYKLAAFVTWPPAALAAGEPFRICTAGREDIAAPLDELVRGQQALGRPIAVSRVTSRSAAVLRQCQILFVGSASTAEVAALSSIGSAPVLTVTDRGGGGHAGVIEFVVQGGHVRFVIHRSEADSRRLQINSKLLSVAAAVVP